MFSLWSLFFLTLVTSTLARVGGPARLDALPHTARLELRDTSCPTGNIVGSYWPAWTSAVQSPSTYPWSRAGDLAFYFTMVTTADGMTLPAGQAEDDIASFVSNAKQNGKKALFTVGGWTGSVWFSDLVATSSSRKKFAETLATFMDNWGFNGVDIDWEFIGRQGAGNNKVRSEDSDNFLLFLKQLRKTIGSNKLITAAVPATGITGPDGNNLASTREFAAYLDFITIMAYDFAAASWSATTGPNAGLRQCNAGVGGVEESVNAWIASGFPACRLLLGVPGYSHLFKTKTNKLATSTYNGTKTVAFQELASDQPSDPIYTYNNLIEKGWLTSDGSAGAGGYERIYDNCTETPQLFNPTTRTFISYDDATSLGRKATFARSKGLAGVVFYDSTGPSTAVFDFVGRKLSGKN